MNIPAPYILDKLCFMCMFLISINWLSFKERPGQISVEELEIVIFLISDLLNIDISRPENPIFEVVFLI